MTPQNLIIKQALLEQVSIKLSPSGNNLLTFRKKCYLNVITTVLPAHEPLNKGPALFSKRASPLSDTDSASSDWSTFDVLAAHVTKIV